LEEIRVRLQEDSEFEKRMIRLREKTREKIKESDRGLFPVTFLRRD